MGLLGLVLLAAVSLWVGSRAPMAEKIRLYRTDLPGYGEIMVSDPDGTIVVENHCTAENAVTVVDDEGRGWRVQVPGWSLQWVQTDALGAWINARDVRTGYTGSFYLGGNADGLETCPQTVGEDLKADAMSIWHSFLGLKWRTSLWEESSFRRFVRNMTVEAIPREEVGQTVALGNCLNLRQDGTFCGQLLLVDGKSEGPKVTLWFDPFFFEEDPNQTSYTNADGVQWKLLWFDPPVSGEDGFVCAESCMGRVRIDLPGKAGADSGQILDEARAVLDRISARET